MSTNRPILTKDPSGDNLSQKRARVTLPILVRQAMASQRITYGNLGKELGLHHRALRYPLGCIGDTLLELSKRWQEDVPPIQGLVVNQSTGMPGGSVNFLYGQKIDSRQKEIIVQEKLGKIFSYPKWLKVLDELGLSPVESLNPQFKQPVDHHSGSSESNAHKQLKDYIAQHPRSVELNKSLTPGETEFILPSGDVVDVMFQSARRRIAVEVKSHISPETDIRRGIFQCVKYRAILRACRSLEGGTYEADAILAIEGSLSKELIAVRNTLGVKVIENVRVEDSN
ncbi:MAG: hypothetical protein OXI63_01230 [Candidatus Poribacteria bacterium]|nr:hypothetical protein [Candidatus Poribacteria bacterium]